MQIYRKNKAIDDFDYSSYLSKLSKRTLNVDEEAGSYSKFSVVVLLALFAVIALSANSAFANNGETNSKTASIPLLALTETGSNVTGAVAELELEVRDGDEKVFLETYPLTKISTQISMRFAQQISCKEMDIYCAGFDFIYTIKATPGIVGGPSAGAAAAVLTTALLKKLPLDNSTAITGTINSGGIIGAVGGLNEKISAAAKAGFKKVLIPKGQATIKQENKTIDLIAFGTQLGVEIVEVATLPENLAMEQEYLSAMAAISQETCDKANSLEQANQRFATSNETIKLLEEGANLTRMGRELFANESYYGSASYCFRANIKQKTLLLGELGKKQLEDRLNQAVADLDKIENETDSKNVTTLTALQAYMLVKERIVEARKGIDDVNATRNDTEQFAENLAYVEERIYSSQTWSKFFDVTGKSFEIGKDEIKKSCLSKLAEAEERKAYAESLLPFALEGVIEEIEQAYSYLDNKEYELCLYSAAKAKSEADVVISLSSIDESEAPESVKQKLDVVKSALIKAQKRGFLPIIGYSYYDYASVLLADDPATSALFAEHALELSAIDIYFEKTPAGGEQNGKAGDEAWLKSASQVVFKNDIQLAFAVGFLVGIVVAVAIARRKMKLQKKKHATK
jgi:predicted S18 family serine protease